MSTTAVVMFVVGAVGLVGGAELLVRSASRIAVRTGLSSVVIGLTVVAMGTSAPELAVSAGAALGGEADIAIGNVVGSNIANILLVLGVAAAVATGGLLVAQQIVRLDVPLMIGASALVLVLSLNGALGRLEGLLLLSLLVAYVAWTVRASRKETAEVAAEYDEALEGARTATSSPVADVVVGLVGLALLVVGARLLVTSASDIARDLGVSDLVIGLTVVAVGTSAPEIATSIIAAVKGERDIAVGNAVGSNLFNLLGVLGVTAILAPDGVGVSDDALRLDLPVMLAVAVACLPVFFNGYLLKRWEGVLFVGFYGAYLAFLVLDSTGSGLRDPFAVVMGVFVIPLTAVTLVVVAVRAWRAQRTGTPLPERG